MMRMLSWKVVVALQLAVLLFISGSYYAAGMYGKEIAIKTKPVDPSDLLYGDYVTLNYEISDVDPSLWPGKWKSRDEDIYVVLTKDKGQHYTVKKLSKERPEVSGSDVAIKAQAAPGWSETKETISLTYGLERFYVKDNTGTALEKKAGNMTAVVKIAPWGQVRLLELKD
ncbi:GDYXXLXY domain-containing protein [Fictibacillus iocasae]|uniref:GDYXXLXY domain-containing protein n=1 Tax=Fictibacillus iocasae TaxID=2715437 RepID=A0ABW2NU50_9BACL